MNSKRRQPRKNIKDETWHKWYHKLQILEHGGPFLHRLSFWIFEIAVELEDSVINILSLVRTIGYSHSMSDASNGMK